MYRHHICGKVHLKSQVAREYKLNHIQIEYMTFLHNTLLSNNLRVKVLWSTSINKSMLAVSGSMLFLKIQSHFSLKGFLGVSNSKGSESEVTQLCPTLQLHGLCSLPGSSVHGIFQARVLEWVAISFSRESSRSRDPTQVLHIVGRLFTDWATREVPTVNNLPAMWENWILYKTILCPCPI